MPNAEAATPSAEGGYATLRCCPPWRFRDQLRDPGAPDQYVSVRPIRYDRPYFSASRKRSGLAK